jgi:hypothetical protein
MLKYNALEFLRKVHASFYGYKTLQCAGWLFEAGAGLVVNEQMACFKGRPTCLIP